VYDLVLACLGSVGLVRDGATRIGAANTESSFKSSNSSKTLNELQAVECLELPVPGLVSEVNFLFRTWLSSTRPKAHPMLAKASIVAVAAICH
jgi:hypothetical protein